MLQRIETYIKSLIEGKRGFFATIFAFILLLLSFGFRLLSFLHRKLYDWKLLQQRQVLAPVISIGNIVAGGSGKTPCVLMLAEELGKKYRVGIVLGGYRSLSYKKKEATRVDSNSDVREVGDEAKLLARRLNQAIVVVCKNRARGAELAIEQGANLILLDDGLQHRRLQRNFEIIVVDAFQPLSNGHFLPRGYLRESPKALKRANLIVLTGCDSKEVVDRAKNAVQAFTNAPIIQTTVAIEGVFDIQSEKQKNSIQNEKVGIFCAIANPRKFKKMLEDQKIEIVSELIGMDHMPFSSKQLYEFAKECLAKGAKFLLCTEKDLVKINPLVAYPLPIMWIKINLVTVVGNNHGQETSVTSYNSIAEAWREYSLSNSCTVAKGAWQSYRKR